MSTAYGGNRICTGASSAQGQRTEVHIRRRRRLFSRFISARYRDQTHPITRGTPYDTEESTLANDAGHNAASPHARRLATHALEYLRDHPAVSVDELLTAVMRRFPGQRRERLVALLDEAVAAGFLHRDSSGRISAPDGAI